MWKYKTLVEPDIRDKILTSENMEEGEKSSFLKFVAYLTTEEKDELLLLI